MIYTSSTMSLKINRILCVTYLWTTVAHADKPIVPQCYTTYCLFPLYIIVVGRANVQVKEIKKLIFIQSVCHGSAPEPLRILKARSRAG